VIDFSSIFQGMTPPPFRPFLLDAFKYLKDKYPKIIIPCCGNFTVPQIAVQAGYKQENITTSDISIYSALIGSYIQGKELKTMDLEISHPFYDKIKKSGICEYAEILLLMKCLQLREYVYYEETYLIELLERSKVYINKFKKGLDNIREILNGITYRERDLREEIKEFSDNKGMVIYVNPPAYAKGYEKMFDFRGAIARKTPNKIKEFVWGKEYNPMFIKSLKSKALMMFYRYKFLESEQKRHEVYAVEYEIGSRCDFILCNRKEELEEGIRRSKIKPRIKISSMNKKIWSGDLKEDAIIGWKETKKEHALYYRNLWAHRIGDSKAEIYMIWTINGEIFGTVGLHFSGLMRQAETRVIEAFGFCVSNKKYDNINRLLMWCLTSGQMKEDLINKTFIGNNPLIDPKGIKTACLSKYRKVKLNNGILAITKKKKDKVSGVYHLLYEADFRNDNYKDCVRRYLEEWRIRKKRK